MSLSCGAGCADEVESPDFGGGRQRAAGWGHLLAVQGSVLSAERRLVR